MSKRLSASELDIGINDLPYNVACRAYPAKFLIKISHRIGVENTEQKKRFIDGVRHAGNRYLFLTKANQNRLQPNQQNKLLEEYKKLLQLTRKKHQEIQKSTAASGKLSKALREKYEEVKDAAMKQMLEPYCNSSGMAISLFEDFLELLSDAANEAKKKKVGNDKADLSGKILAEWVAAIGKCWPQDAKIRFSLGKRDNEIGIYARRLSLPF